MMAWRVKCADGFRTPERYETRDEAETERERLDALVGDSPCAPHAVVER